MDLYKATEIEHTLLLTGYLRKKSFFARFFAQSTVKEGGKKGLISWAIHKHYCIFMTADQNNIINIHNKTQHRGSVSLRVSGV